MGNLVRFSSPGKCEVVGFREPDLVRGEVRISTAYSGISAGTELTAYRGSNPYLSKHWDSDVRLFLDGDSTHHYPLDGWGYEEVGTVVEVGSDVDRQLVGRHIWGAWGHRTSAVRSAEWVRARCMPVGADLITGVFAKIGAIALNSILDANIHVGETVVVFGAGVPGQIVAQLAGLSGARVVVADPMAERRAMAEKLCGALTFDPTIDDVAGEVRQLTRGRGADVAIEISGHYAALEEAVRTVAYSSTVVAAGFFQGDASQLHLGHEFHHNRIAVVGSQISGVSPGLQHRWNEVRMSQTVLELGSDGRIDLRSLVSHVIPATRAPEAFDMLDTAPEEALQVVLDYTQETR